jgi:hypothetical protein
MLGAEEQRSSGAVEQGESEMTSDQEQRTRDDECCMLGLGQCCSRLHFLPTLGSSSASD